MILSSRKVKRVYHFNSGCNTKRGVRGLLAISVVKQPNRFSISKIMFCFCPYSNSTFQFIHPQVQGQTSQPDTSKNTASDSSKVPAKKREDVNTVIRSEVKITRDPCITHRLGQQERDGSCILPSGSQDTTCSGSFELRDNLDRKKLEKQADSVELTNSSAAMLSSSVVTVLAPHWNGRLRRTKRFEATGSSEGQGSFQDVTNDAADQTHEHFQKADEFQAQSRVPFQGTRRNTVGCSTESGPASYETKRRMMQTVSLDANSGKMDSSQRDVGALRPGVTTARPLSLLSLDPNEQIKNAETVHQELSSSSSKPTTSSLLLSLRRFNSNSRISTARSTSSEMNLSSSSTNLSQNARNNNEHERLKQPISPSTSSFGTTETGSALSPSSSNQKEMTMFETRFFAVSPTNRETRHPSFTQQPETSSRSQSSLSYSRQPILSRGPSERQLKYGGLDKSTNLENSVSLHRHSSYDRSELLKTHSLPRRTTLTTTSWWKEVSHEGDSPLTCTSGTAIKNKPHTNLDSPYNDKSNLVSPGLTGNKIYSSQLCNSKDNNNTTESVHKGNLNHVLSTQGGTHSLKQRNPEDLPDHDSDRLVRQQNGLISNREPQKARSLADVLTSSKISRATVQTIMSQPRDLPRHDLNHNSLTANSTETPLSLLNPKGSNTPTKSSGKYINNYCGSKNSLSSASYHRDSQRISKPMISLGTTSSLNQASKNLPMTLNTKTSSSFHSHSVATQSSGHASSHNSSSSLTSKFANTGHTTPLGFERSYASIPKPVHSKIMSSVVSTASAISKMSYSPVNAASTISSLTGVSHSATTSASSLSLLTPPVTPARASSSNVSTVSSFLTPPATPIITSPSYSNTSSPKEGKTFLSSEERDTNKVSSQIEAKKARRVTWEDSVDLGEPISPEPPQVPGGSPSASRSPRGIKAPSIFSFLRSSSPTPNTAPLCSITPKTSSIQVEKGGKYRSLSSDSADLPSRGQERSKQRPSDTVISDQGRRPLTTLRQGRTLSAESGTVQSYTSSALSLPPDFSSSYKLRYSSTPYSTLMSNRSTQGEAKATTPRSPLFQQLSQSNYAAHRPIHTDPVQALSSKPPLPPISLPQAIYLPSQNKTKTRESSKHGCSETDQINNNHTKSNSKNNSNDQLLLVNNRVHVSSQSLQDEKTDSSSSTCVTETLVYSIKPKVDVASSSSKNTMSKPLQHPTNAAVSAETMQSPTVQSRGTPVRPCSHSDQSSTGSSSTDSQTHDDESNNRRMNALGKSKFFSVEGSSGQSPKRSRFALKKSVSTPASNLSRSESERVNKSNNKVDQVLNKLRQTFSSRRSDDDMLFPWKWKKASQAPSVSGSSDISNVSDNAVESTKPLEKQDQEKGAALKDPAKRSEVTDKWTQNQYVVTLPSASGSSMSGEKFYVWSNKPTPETHQEERNACTESKKLSHLTTNTPASVQLDFYKDNTADYKPTNQFHSCRDPSPGRCPVSPAAYPSQFGKSTPSPRSPFSPFSSLSPLSSIPSSEMTDDSVFYSPKLQRRRESSSPCEPREGLRLGSSRRSRASTGPPSASPGHDKECLTSSYADLKYGIEPGRSFSVSSVLSSRPSGPGRISTGSRFMSVGDLSDSAMTCRGSAKDLDHWCVTPDWMAQYDCQLREDRRMPYFPSDPGKMRSRSLPRSLTRRLANWSSSISASPEDSTSTKPPQQWSPKLNCHFSWDTEGPPTPPPTPPLSPVSRRISKPTSLSSPTFPSSPGSPQHVDNPASRGHLPSRSYVSSLSTFEESDCSSDTTTDDEYYLETGDDGEKETEL